MRSPTSRTSSAGKPAENDMSFAKFGSMEPLTPTRKSLRSATKPKNSTKELGEPVIEKQHPELDNQVPKRKINMHDYEWSKIMHKNASLVRAIHAMGIMETQALLKPFDEWPDSVRKCSGRKTIPLAAPKFPNESRSEMKIFVRSPVQIEREKRGEWNTSLNLRQSTEYAVVQGSRTDTIGVTETAERDLGTPSKKRKGRAASSPSKRKKM